MELKVVYGAIAANDREIAILSRSMLQIMIDWPLPLTCLRITWPRSG